MKKPPFISHFLILRDLLKGIDITTADGKERYFTSRPENIICEFRKRGILIDEKAIKMTKFSWCKPYRLIQTTENIALAKMGLKIYEAHVESWKTKQAAKSEKAA